MFNMQLHLSHFGHDRLLGLLTDDSSNFVLRYIQVVIVLCRQSLLQNHIVVILVYVEMGSVTAVDSEGDILLFTENNHNIYYGLQLKAIVSRIGFKPDTSS